MRRSPSSNEEPSASCPRYTRITRRTFAKGVLALAALQGVCETSIESRQADASAPSVKPAPPRMGLAFGTYGMKTLTIEESLKTIAKIGYDGVEPSLIAGWPTDPATMSAADRKSFRRLIDDTGLTVPAMLESLPLVGTPQSVSANLERVKRAVDLGNEWFPNHPPIVETILGGKTAQWDQVKGRMVDELKQWAKVAENGRTTICFKPHAGDAVQSAERALWLLQKVGSPRLRIVYDYSHFYVEGFPLEASLRQLFADTSLIVVKDSEGTPAKHNFLLPGDGKTDYPAYFRLLKELGYRGSVVVEVSAMIHRMPDYQPIPTAKLCYARLAPLMAQAGIRTAAASRGNQEPE
jgi:sugar phosphate isomerase/epimerase